MVVREVARLAHAHRVKQAVFVRAGPRGLVSTILSVTTGAHVLEQKLEKGKKRI